MYSNFKDWTQICVSELYIYIYIYCYIARGGERYFGIKENRREEYPSMFELMAWNMQNKQGNIVRPEDFTKKPYLPSNRIQKNGTHIYK